MTEWVFLRSDDFAGTLTPAGGVPTRTSRPDEIALWHLANRTLLVDTGAGVVCRADGVTRAERPRDDGSGMVYLGRVAGKIRWARAHRVVWIAKHGPIPGMYEIVPLNGRRWDNRIANLTIVNHAAVMRHANRTEFIGEHSAADRPTVHPYATSANRVGSERARRRNIA